MVSLLIRLLALLGVLWTGKQVAHQVSSAFHPDQKGEKAASPDQETADEMVRDPICQTYIPRSLAIRKTFHGETCYFCSNECASMFSEQHQTEP
jgi:YHS domain-containing protein